MILFVDIHLYIYIHIWYINIQPSGWSSVRSTWTVPTADPAVRCLPDISDLLLQQLWCQTAYPGYAFALATAKGMRALPHCACIPDWGAEVREAGAGWEDVASKGEGIRRTLRLSRWCRWCHMMQRDGASSFTSQLWAESQVPIILQPRGWTHRILFQHAKGDESKIFSRRREGTHKDTHFCTQSVTDLNTFSQWNHHSSGKKSKAKK